MDLSKIHGCISQPPRPGPALRWHHLVMRRQLKLASSPQPSGGNLKEFWQDVTIQNGDVNIQNEYLNFKTGDRHIQNCDFIHEKFWIPSDWDWTPETWFNFEIKKWSNKSTQKLVVLPKKKRSGNSPMVAPTGCSKSTRFFSRPCLESHGRDLFTLRAGADAS